MLSQFEELVLKFKVFYREVLKAPSEELKISQSKHNTNLLPRLPLIKM